MTKKNDKKSNNEKKSKNDISNVKFVNMTNMRSFNMQVYLLTRRLTISYKEVLSTILIVMIYLFMIWIDS
jgi:hypothetical protein